MLGENALAKLLLPPCSCMLLHLYEEVSKTIVADFCTVLTDISDWICLLSQSFSFFVFVLFFLMKKLISQEKNLLLVNDVHVGLLQGHILISLMTQRLQMITSTSNE